MDARHENGVAWEFVQRGEYATALERFQLITAHTNPRLLSDSDFMCQALCFWWLGYPVETAEVLRYALITPYTSSAGIEPIVFMLYVGERLHDAGVRGRAIAALRKRTSRTNPSSTAAFLLGVSNEAAFAEAILSAPLYERHRRTFEFFVGIRALREGDHEAFAERMRRTAATMDRIHGRLWHSLAQWEIEHGFPDRVRSQEWWS